MCVNFSCTTYEQLQTFPDIQDPAFDRRNSIKYSFSATKKIMIFSISEKSTRDDVVDDETDVHGSLSNELEQKEN